jgi:branched-chain amino acid transport system permease protein
VNFAQGEFVMLGALSAASLAAADVPLALAGAAAIALTVLAGAAAERLAIAPARGAPALTLIIITVGVSITLRGLALLIWGVNPRSYDPFTAGPPVDLGGFAFGRQSLWIIAFALAAAALLALFLARTVPGKAMRACAMDREAARLQGISPGRMSLYAFALGAAVAGAAGFVFVPVTNAQYDMGLFLSINGFSAAVVGGLASPLGAVAGGFLLGALEALAAGLVSSSHEAIIAFALLFVVLVARPQGIAGAVAARRA